MRRKLAATGHAKGKALPHGFSIFVLIVVWLIPAALAAACVPQPIVWLEPRSSGPSGSKVTVMGVRFAQGKSEIRWNGLEGPLLATAMGPDFSAPVTVPAVPAGLYTMLVVSRAPNGNVGDVARAEFQVSGSSSTNRSGSEGSSNQATSRSSPSRSFPSERGVLVVLGVGAVVWLLAGWRRRSRSRTKREVSE